MDIGGHKYVEISGIDYSECVFHVLLLEILKLVIKI